MSMKTSFLKPIALGLLLAASPLTLAGKTWQLNLKDADISTLVNEMAEITGKNFVVDPRVKGTVTVLTSRPLDRNALYELFQSVLAINGFAAVPAGPVVKILPDVNARQSGVRFDRRAGGSEGEQLVTRVILLQQASANDLLAALRPMMPQYAHMASVPDANALVLSDRASNIGVMEAVIRELDSGRPDDAIEIIPVMNARAEELVDVLEVVESIPAAPGGKEGRALGRVRLLADDRSNRIVVRGDRALRDRIRTLVRQLDAAPEFSLEKTRFFRLRYARARQVAEVLKGLIATPDEKPVVTTSGASGAAPVSTVPGQPAPSAAGGGSTTITIGRTSLIADETQNALIVRASPRQLRDIEAMLEDLDRRRAQVLIQAAIVEVSGDNAAQLGVQWAFGDPASGVGVINFNNVGASLTSIAAGVVTQDPTRLAAIGQGASIGVGAASNGGRNFVGALIQALNSVSDANLLSTPSIMTLDNQEAKIVVGQNVPFITGSTATSAAGVTNPFTTIQRQDVGITLKVTPSLSEGGVVRLDVEQEVSAVVPSSAGINSADLITSKRSIKTSILADDNQTIVLGGLVQDDIKKSVSKVPLLGDIPLLGVLFRSTAESRSKRNLLVFLQPTIVRDTASARQVTQRQYASLRRVELGLDAKGRLVRLPASIEDIYQGGARASTADGDAASRPASAPALPATPPAAPAVPASAVPDAPPVVIPPEGAAATELPAIPRVEPAAVEPVASLAKTAAAVAAKFVAAKPGVKARPVTPAPSRKARAARKTARKPVR